MKPIDVWRKNKTHFHAEVERTDWKDITSEDEYNDAMTCHICGKSLSILRSTYMWANQHGWERRYFCCDDGYTHIRLLKSTGNFEVHRRRYEWKPRRQDVRS